jgi:hypothetical protein
MTLWPEDTPEQNLTDMLTNHLATPAQGTIKLSSNEPLGNRFPRTAHHTPLMLSLAFHL